MAFPLTPEQEAKLRKRLDLQPDENLDVVFRALGDKKVRELVGAGEIAPAKPPAARPPACSCQTYTIGLLSRGADILHYSNSAGVTRSLIFGS